MSILATFVAARQRRPLGQFGQPGSVATFGGKTACGPTSAQSLLFAFKRILPSLDALARIMGYWRPPRMGGTSAEANAKALNHFHLSYRAAYSQSILQLRALTGKGPVMMVVAYVRYPNWRGYHGRPRPGPLAQPFGHAGANQFPKPAILHWVVFAGIQKGGPYNGLAVVFEPNHGSPARPEKVAVDYITLADLNRAYLAAGSRIAVVPNRAVA